MDIPNQFFQMILGCYTNDFPLALAEKPFATNSLGRVSPADLSSASKCISSRSPEVAAHVPFLKREAALGEPRNDCGSPMKRCPLTRGLEKQVDWPPKTTAPTLVCPTIPEPLKCFFLLVSCLKTSTTGVAGDLLPTGPRFPYTAALASSCAFILGAGAMEGYDLLEFLAHPTPMQPCLFPSEAAQNSFEAARQSCLTCTHWKQASIFMGESTPAPAPQPNSFICKPKELHRVVLFLFQQREPRANLSWANHKMRS